LAIKRVKLERLCTHTNNYVGFGRLWFYDKNGVLYQSGAIVKNDSNLGELDNLYVESTSSVNSSYGAVEAVYTNQAINDYASWVWGSSTKPKDNNWFQVVFKTPLEAISKFQIDVKPYVNTELTGVFVVKFYDEYDNLLAKYEIDPSKFHKNKTKYRILTVTTPELMEKPKYAILQDIQPSGTKNYTIKKVEKDAVPVFWSANYDRVTNKVNASPQYQTYSPESVFNDFKYKEYTYYTYYHSDVVANGVQNVFFEVTFHKPKLINAFEMWTSANTYTKDLKFVVEALDEKENEWIQLGFYEMEFFPQYDFLKVEFDNVNYYHKYRIKFININNGQPLETNKMRFIEHENLIQEVSISSSEDYKKKGISTFENIVTNNLRKLITQNSKVAFGNGYIFSKRFDLNSEKIRSITI
jgi:hypothetical protein